MAGGPLGEVTVRELLSDGGGVILDSEDDDFWQLYRDFPARAELVVDRSIWLTPVPICRRKRHAELAAGCSSLSYARDWTVIEHIRTGALASATGFYATVDDLVAFFTGLLPGETRLLTEDSTRCDARQGE